MSRRVTITLLHPTGLERHPPHPAAIGKRCKDSGRGVEHSLMRRRFLDSTA